jgi:NitT/TauT family transport system ATP-binding protein
MDEPFGALDALTRARMHEFLLSMWDRYQITIIFVTHDIEEAVLLGDRVAVMGGQPPGITEVIPVPLGRPRHGDDVDTEQFIAVKRQIRAALAGPPAAAAGAIPRGIRRRL